MQRLSRLEEEEKNLVETRKRKFFAEVLNAVREFQLQIQASMKRRRQRNDGVLVCYVSFLYLFVFTFYAYLKWDMEIKKQKGDRRKKFCLKIIWKTLRESQWEALIERESSRKCRGNRLIC
jgi:hypothetical protein